MRPLERAELIRRAAEHRRASGEALRAFWGLPVAGQELPERLGSPADRPAGVDRFVVGWHLGIVDEAAPA